MEALESSTGPSDLLDRLAELNEQAEVEAAAKRSAERTERVKDAHAVASAEAETAAQRHARLLALFPRG